MNKAIVRCRCGHQVLAKEVLRTDLYERSSGREYIYLKFRCARCKRLGQSFIPEAKWDWSALEGDAKEWSDAERERFAHSEPISAVELLHFHAQLQSISSPAELALLDSNHHAEPSSTPENAVPLNLNSEADSGEAQSSAPEQTAPGSEEPDRNERAKPPRFEGGRSDTGRLRGRGEAGERGETPRSPQPQPDGEENSTP